MYKIFSRVLSAFVAISLLVFTSTALAEDTPNINFDGKNLNFDVPPQIQDGRMLVPLRAILEALGLELQWNDETQTATAKGGNTSIVLPVGSNKANVNGKDVNLDVPAQVVNGRTLVPLRFLSENSGANVKWDEESNTAYIESANYSKTINNNTNISNVSGSTININNSNVDNSVNNSNNITNNINNSTTTNNNINTSTNNTNVNSTVTSNVYGNTDMNEVIKQIEQQKILKSANMIQIKYNVMDNSSSKPIKDAVIWVNGMANAVTNENGAATVDVYPYATCMIKISKDGYTKYEATVSFTKATDITITLKAAISQ